MIFWTIMKVAMKSLWAHKLRAFLAMLGIIMPAPFAIPRI